MVSTGQTASKFQYDLKTGVITGPAEYMSSEHFAETKRRIENGTHILIAAFPSSTPVATMVEVIFQTDYAAWLGMRQTARELGMGEQ